MNTATTLKEVKNYRKLLRQKQKCANLHTQTTDAVSLLKLSSIEYTKSFCQEPSRAGLNIHKKIIRFSRKVSIFHLLLFRTTLRCKGQLQWIFLEQIGIFFCMNCTCVPTTVNTHTTNAQAYFAKVTYIFIKLIFEEQPFVFNVHKYKTRLSEQIIVVQRKYLRSQEQ